MGSPLGISRWPPRCLPAVQLLLRLRATEHGTTPVITTKRVYSTVHPGHPRGGEGCAVPGGLCRNTVLYVAAKKRGRGDARMHPDIQARSDTSFIMAVHTVSRRQMGEKLCTSMSEQ